MKQIQSQDQQAKTAEYLSTIIAEIVTNVDEVDFTGYGTDSLFAKICMKIKRARLRTRHMTYYRIWQDNVGSIREVVDNLLRQKIGATCVNVTTEDITSKSSPQNVPEVPEVETRVHIDLEDTTASDFLEIPPPNEEELQSIVSLLNTDSETLLTEKADKCMNEEDRKGRTEETGQFEINVEGQPENQKLQEITTAIHSNSKEVLDVTLDLESEIDIIDSSSTDETQKTNSLQKTTKDVDCAEENKVLLVLYNDNGQLMTEELDVAPREVIPMTEAKNTKSPTRYYYAGKQFVVSSKLFYKQEDGEEAQFDSRTRSFQVRQGINAVRKELDEDALRCFIKGLMTHATMYKCPLRIYSVRENKHGVVAYAICRYESHKQKFKIEFDDMNEQDAIVFVYVEDNPKFTVPIVHSGRSKMEQLRGDERKEVQKQLQHQNPQSYYDQELHKINKHVAEEGNFQNLRHASTYKKAANEVAIQARRKITSSDIADVVQLCRDHYKLRDPYVRLAGEPYRVHMYSRQQLNTIRAEDVIAHFDATGSIVRKPEMQVNGNQCDPVIHKVILYYAMVIRKTEKNMKKGENGITIPVMEMVTCEHDITSIGYILARYKAFVEAEHVKWPLFRVIVIDWSWAIIHAMIKELLETNIVEYLQMMYDILQQAKNLKENFILIYYCTAHNQHRISKAIKRNFSMYTGKRIVLECTALMIECKTLKDLDNVFVNTMTILKSKSAETAVAAMGRLYITGQEQDREDIDEEAKDENNELSSIAFPDDEKSKTIYLQSPFYKRYNELAAKVDTILSANETSEQENKNNFYSPDLAAYIIKNYMSYAPMWTAVILNLIVPEVTRLSNAPAEGYFNLVKHELLKSKKNMSAGDFVRTMSNYINDLCSRSEIKELLKYQESMQRTQVKKLVDPDDAEVADNVNVTEGWKRSDLKQKGTNKRKSYFDRSNLHSEIKKSKSSTNLISQQQIIECKPSCDLEDTIARNSSNETVSTESIHENALPNALFQDPQYYMTEIRLGKDILHYHMGLYVCDHDIPAINNMSMLLQATDYRSLRPRTYISSNVVDCYAIGKIGSSTWNNVNYFPASETYFMIGDGYRRDKSKDWIVYKMQCDFNGVVLLPYVFKKHWMLLVLDVNKETMKHIDPLTRHSHDKERVVKALKTHFNDCQSEGCAHNLCHIEWKTIEDDEDRPIQKDSCNCGAYLMYYLDCIGTGKPLKDPSFKPSQMRIRVSEELLALSESMKYICYICSKNSNEWSVQCGTCKHWVHTKCVRHLDNDDKTDYYKEKDAVYNCKPCSMQKRPWMTKKDT